MEHIDIEVSESDSSILIFTEEGELIEMHVPPRSESIVAAISTRPPASIAVSAWKDSERLVRSLRDLGHDVSLTMELVAG
jgi:hypothetical protein